MTWMVGRAWALASACMIMSCNDRPDGDGSGAGTDTGSETGSMTADDSTGEPPFFGVRRNTVVTFIAADGSLSTRSYDPTEEERMWAVEVGTGAARQSFPGEYDGVGWLEFPDVPEGPYVLHDSWSRPVFMALDMREIDADGVLRAGRNTALVALTGTPQISLTVPAMVVAGENDELELYSRSVDALYTGISPALGAGALTGLTIPWDAVNVVGEEPFVEPLAGDDLWLTHFVAEPVVAEPTPEFDDAWEEALVKRIVEATPLELDQAIADGPTPADARGSFVAVATEPVSLDLRLDQFRAEIDANLGSLGDELVLRCAVEIVVAPGEDEPVLGMTPRLAEIMVSNSCSFGVCESETPPPPPGDRVVELELGNPFDFGTEMVTVQCLASSYLTHPEAQTDEYVLVVLAFSRPLADAGPIAPALGMPSDIHIGGEPCGVNDVVTGVGTTPTISLSAPSVGVADSYKITIMRLDGYVGLLGDPDRLGSFETTATTFTLPEGLLEPGAYYCLQVEARSGQRLGEARAYSHEQHRATATSGVFAP